MPIPPRAPGARFTRGVSYNQNYGYELRLTALAKTQGGASQRPSVLAEPMFVCCCVGQAKVNGCHKPQVIMELMVGLDGWYHTFVDIWAMSTRT